MAIMAGCIKSVMPIIWHKIDTITKQGKYAIPISVIPIES